ncbi:MAG TPA: HD domain-containing protein [Clostridia bacterium]
MNQSFDDKFNILKTKAEQRNNLYSDYAVKDSDALRRKPTSDYSVYRTPFIIDTDRIIHNIFYNRYVDKTQVFSLFKNDDITRRGQHIQYVSRIARTIGQALSLNLDLIEAIALGHDIGHTPFGHKGEEFLNENYHKYTGRYFRHNVHSVRVLDKITKSNLCLQTLDGILCHNGEKPKEIYKPSEPYDFDEFDKMVERCYTDEEYSSMLVPCTLEGCVVRISDIIAYLGKDRQDVLKVLGEKYGQKIYYKSNREIIKELTDSIIYNSLGQNYIAMDSKVYREMKEFMDENYELIYKSSRVNEVYYETIKPMFDMLYERFLYDVKMQDYSSYIFKHHFYYAYLPQNYIDIGLDLENDIDCNDLVVDYIASMTDDYFVEVFQKLFPDSKLKIKYISYFEDNL